MIKTVKAALYVVPVLNLLAFSSQPNPMIPECTAIPPGLSLSQLRLDGRWEGGKRQERQTSRINETGTLISIPEEGPNAVWCDLERMGFLRNLLNKSHLSGGLVYKART